MSIIHQNKTHRNTCYQYTLAFLGNIQTIFCFFFFFFKVRHKSVQFSHSVVSDYCDPMDSSIPGFPVHHQLQSLLKLKSIEPMPSNHLILCYPLLSPSIFPSIRVFSNESVLCIRWPKYCNFSFSFQ